MANTTETVFIEFVVNDDQLESTTDTLERTGKIDKATADQFKLTNVELQKRATVLNTVAKAATDVSQKTGASIDEVRKVVERMVQEFATGMQEGVIDSLKEASIQSAKLKERIAAINQGSPFEKLTKDLTDARSRVLNIAAAMEQLRRTGGVDTEQFTKLGKLLILRTAELDRLQETYDNVTSAVDRNKKSNEENEESVVGLTSAQEELAKKLLELKTRLTDTGKSTSFEKLSKSLTDARAKVLNISASLLQLRKTGGVDTEQFENLSASLVKSQSDLDRLQIEYDEVTSSVERNNDEVERSNDVQETLRQRLGEITKQLQLLKFEGKDNTEQYKELVVEAGNVKDAIGDVSQEIRGAAANSQALEGLVGIAQGVTAGFAVAQGAVGLFGVKSEELEETLLNVNSAMALLQGTQQLVALAQGESATVTFIQTAAQKLYNIVVGESIGLLAAFRIALAATGIGLLIILLVSLAQSLKKTNKETEEANRLLQRNKNIIDADTSAIQRNTEENIARAEAINAKESEIIELRGHGLLLQRAAVEEANALLLIQLNTLDKTSEAYFKLNKQVSDNKELIKEVNSKLILEQINLVKQRKTEELQGISDTLEARLAGAVKNTKNELNLAKQTARAKAAIDLNEAGDNLPKRLLIEAQLQKDIRALDLQFAQVRQQDRIDQTERALLNAQQRSRQINARINQEEIDVQKQLVREKARLELLQEGLTANARKLIIERSLNDQKQLQKDFNQQSSRETLEDLVSRNNAELSSIKLTNKERLSINEENLIAQSQIEIDANVGLVDKIKEIRGKLNEDLRALRLAALQKELSDELSLEASRTGALRRASERTVANENKSLGKRIAAINQLAALDIASVNSKEDALDESLRKQLITQEDYNVQYAALKDEELKITEDTELKKRALTLATQKENLLLALDTAQQFLGIIQSFGQQQTESELARIDAQRTEIDELREAGAITEKEALLRQKKLDNEEKAIKRKQAERDKAIALFSAIINTAAAIVKALPNLVLAGIAAALGAAQIALIASKPIPKFAKGKKGNYEGPGEIGEAGAELMESKGKMYLAKKSTFVWVGKHDKVFNPKETAAMLEHGNMQPYLIKDGNTKEYKSVYNNQIDYDKLGKTIAGNIPKTGLNVDQNGFTEWVQHKNSFTKYLDNRRSY